MAIRANPGYAVFNANADRLGKITSIFPYFFFLVAALVSLTTMTRMVESERVEIGTLKALGRSQARIVSKYLLYAGSAAVLGSVSGVLIGSQLFPKVIWNAYRVIYSNVELSTPLQPGPVYVIVADVASAGHASASPKPSKVSPCAAKPGWPADGSVTVSVWTSWAPLVAMTFATVLCPLTSVASSKTLLIETSGFVAEMFTEASFSTGSLVSPPFATVEVALLTTVTDCPVGMVDTVSFDTV